MGGCKSYNHIGHIGSGKSLGETRPAKVDREEKSGVAEDAIDWQIAFDLEDVQVIRLAKMYKVSKKDIWPLMQLATHVATSGKEGGRVPLEVRVAASSTAVITCGHTCVHVIV